LNITLPLFWFAVCVLAAICSIGCLGVAFVRLAGRHTRASQRLAAVERIARLGTWEADASLREARISEGAALAIGLAHPPKHGRDLLRRFARPDRHKLLQAVRTVCRDGAARTCIVEVAGVTPARWLEVTIEQEPRGVCVRLRGTVTDVTAVRTLDAERAQARATLESFFRNSPICMTLRGTDGRFQLVSPEFDRMFGFRPGTAIDRRATDLFPQHHTSHTSLAVQQVVSDGDTVRREYEQETALGRLSLVAVRFPVTGSDGQVTGVGSITLDVTEIRRAAESVRQNEAWLEAAFDQASVGIGIRAIDPTAPRWLRVNQKLCEILGYSREELLSLTTFEMTAPEDRAVTRTINEKFARGEIQWYKREKRYLRKDGSVVWANVSMTVVRNPDGTIKYGLSVVEDISDRVETREALLANELELRRHRDQLQELVAERTADLRAAKEAAETANAAKTMFLANMSHELRSPMHAILSFARLGRDGADRIGTEKAQRYFAQIHKSGTRLLDLLNDLLDLAKLDARKGSFEFVPANLDDIVREAVQEMKAFADSRRIEITVVAGPTPTTTICDRRRVGDVLRNLLSNAIKFSHEGGAVEISVGEAAGAAPDASDWATIAVRDEGVGIPQGELESIFDRFVQSSKTRTGAGGTGLGLAIAREIVVAHQGTLVASNNPQGGATFTLRLPTRAAQVPELSCAA
jgi:PAS domain S-box-containing protein